MNVHASESLRTITALSEAALSIVVANLPPSSTSRTQVATVAMTLQKSIMERAAREGVAYANFLLKKAHESHADERRRISRELHDRVAHYIMVAFRSLELYEIYGTRDAPEAPAKLELAKSSIQEALEVTRGLSRELRNTSAEEGLEEALSKLLSTSVPENIRSWISVKGSESLVTPHVRDELFLILREGIRNAAMHSRTTTIAIEVDINENRIRSTVKDNGRGFEPKKEAAQSGGVGLTSMRERSSLLGGTLDLTSEPGKGTKIEIFLPLTRRRD